MQHLIGNKPTNRNYGEDIDSLIRIRDRAKVDLVKSRMALLEMGVKTTKEDHLNHLPGLDAHLYQQWNKQEFSWEAEYKDRTIVKQFDGRQQHHYGHIDQGRLAKIRWISCFDYPTDSQEKRVIITLNFQTGHFDFINGYCPQEVREAVIQGFPEIFEPKLILKMVKRVSTSQTYPEGVIDEISEYNRYLLGWEGTEKSPKAKQLICIEPNGLIHLWHD